MLSIRIYSTFCHFVQGFRQKLYFYMFSAAFLIISLFILFSCTIMPHAGPGGGKVVQITADHAFDILTDLTLSQATHSNPSKLK